jgi:hypothetical protein
MGETIPSTSLKEKEKKKGHPHVYDSIVALQGECYEVLPSLFMYLYAI